MEMQMKFAKRLLRWRVHLRSALLSVVEKPIHATINEINLILHTLIAYKDAPKLPVTICMQKIGLVMLMSERRSETV